MIAIAVWHIEHMKDNQGNTWCFSPLLTFKKDRKPSGWALVGYDSADGSVSWDHLMDDSLLPKETPKEIEDWIDNLDVVIKPAPDR